MPLRNFSMLALVLAFYFNAAGLHAEESAEQQAAPESTQGQADLKTQSGDEVTSAAEQAHATGDSDTKQAEAKVKASDVSDDEQGGSGKMTAGLVAGLGSACLCAPVTILMGLINPFSACAACPVSALGFAAMASGGVITTNLLNHRETTLSSLVLPGLAGTAAGLLSGGGIYLAYEINRTPLNSPIAAAAIAISALLGASLTGLATAIIYSGGGVEEAIADAKSLKKEIAPKEEKAPEKPAETKPDPTPENVPGPDTGFYY